ncbi:MAG: iron ABC transporter permease [Gemmatimonadetes bacterium]|nr:MAG: iron ABC transporter permease [Gemmatimonadota bacterium]
MYPKPKTKFITLLSCLALAVALGLPFIGTQAVSWHDLIGNSRSTSYFIFWNLRFPRVMLAMTTGGILAAAGVAFQALFRNPLATPYTLGVSSGAAFGAALTIKLGITMSLMGISGVSLGAFSGALLVVLIIYSFTQIRNDFSTSTMLLAGVAMSIFFSSLILLLQFLADFTQTVQIVRWLMGSLAVIGYQPLVSILPLGLIGLITLFWLRMDMNMMLMGEELAASRGVHVNRTKLLIFLSVSLMTSAVVSVCGPIGFIGLIIPHAVRRFVGIDHFILLPSSILVGAIFLALSDTLARMMIAPTEIPVGVITALVGGPFFLWILLRKDLEM